MTSWTPPPRPTKQPLLLATGNRHKLEEVAAILTDWQVEASDPDVVETGATFTENALLKARTLAESTGLLAIADDSGIEIDALDGAPGVHSARWTEEADWIPRVLRELEGVKQTERGCAYVCVAAACWPDGRGVSTRGVVAGRIAEKPKGTGGFGYDPVMVPLEGDGRTFAEMTAAEKRKISHRGRAFRALAEYLVEPSIDEVQATISGDKPTGQ